ncbi:hypothetical protein [Streptomyces griseus]|uniref:hypothetical protein n=1 Tax=Streptomyces griseus TaxID=1911 RepID=UPI0033AF1D2A
MAASTLLAAALTMPAIPATADDAGSPSPAPTTPATTDDLGWGSAPAATPTPTSTPTNRPSGDLGWG